MSGRREVNVERPEHSWIPFYRELAEKLVNDGWRERQGELVGAFKGMLERLDSERVPVPDIGQFLDGHVDPFTVFAVIGRNLNAANYRKSLEACKNAFKLDAQLPEKPEIPYVVTKVAFFGQNSDIGVESAKLWDTFEFVLGMDDTKDPDNQNKLAELIDMCLEIDEVGMNKLTGGFYWINPEKFLRSDTLSVLLGDVARAEIEDGDGDFYVECLDRGRSSTNRPFPEINIDEYLSRKIRAENQMWLVRAQGGEWTDAFVKNGYIGIGYGMDNTDLTQVSSRNGVRELYESEHPAKVNRGSAGHDVGNISRFHLDIHAGDYVVTPRRNGQTLHYGEVEGGGTYYMYKDVGQPCRNRKNVIWAGNTLHRRSIGTFSWSQVTISKVNDRVKRGVFAHMLRKGLPGGAAATTSIEGYGIEDMIEDGVFFDKGELDRNLARFKNKKNLILQGAPGVGKTFVSKRLAYALMGERADDRVWNVQFHQSYSYEEFVQGYRPTTNKDEQLIFEPKAGAFLRLCEKARERPDDRYVMVIDEINRGNLSRVFGELLSLIEKDKRGEEFEVALSSGMRFSVPENVYLLGTMNLADRSLAGMDYAMRRRFAFVTLEPQFGESVFEDWLRGRNVPDTMVEQINERMSALNEAIGNDASLGRNFAVGHSYFCDIADGGEDDWDRWYREKVETEVRPLLEEYWFDDADKADGEVRKWLSEM